MTPNAGLLERSSGVEHLELSIAKKAVRQLKPGRGGAKRAVQELFNELRSARLKRSEGGTDRWMDDNPEPGRASASAGEKRLNELREFYQEKAKEALIFAKSFLHSDEDAEDAVAEAFLRLASGKTKPAFFFRTLKHIAVDKYRNRETVRRTFGATEGSAGQSRSCSSMGFIRVDLGERASKEPMAMGDAGRDPLDILVERENLELAKTMAKTEREFWWIRQKKWGKELGLWPEQLERVNETGSSNE